MRVRTTGLTALAVGGGAVLLVRGLQRRSADGSSGGRNRWRAVTVAREPEEVMPQGRVPEPLAALGELVEVGVRVAPGGKGTELRARLRAPEPQGAASAAARLSGDDPRQRVRSALREAKQLIEVGEVLRVDPTPHGRRKATPAGAAVEASAKRAAGEGVL
jgi:uncharacterized membrane protein